MRKYDKKNKMNIGIIIGISIVIIVIFSYFIFKVISMSRIEYKIDKGSIFYDNDKNMTSLVQDGLVKVKWGSKYYVLIDETNYLLGNNGIIYNPNSGKLALYGKFYEIMKDATVVIKNKETILESTAIGHFYKIADRKYLVVDSKITTGDGLLDTSNYLIVELDKQGNATLYNNEVNVKAMTQTKITTNDYTFDVANEILIYGDNKIDLKKIIGSTNEYSPKDIIVDDKKDNDSNTNNSSNNNANNTNNGNENNISNGNSNTTIYDDNNSKGDSSNNSNVTENIQVTKRTSVIRVVPSISSIAIDYVIYDPKNEYKNVYVEIVNEKNNTSTTVNLNKNSTNVNISNLETGTKYKLYFNYTYIDSDGNMKNYNYNTVSVTTKIPVMALSLNDITSSKIGYKIDLDDTYNVDKVVISIINNDKVVGSYTKTNVGNVNSFSDYIDVSNYDLSSGIVTVKISNMVIDGNNYDTNVYYKFSY